MSRARPKRKKRPQAKPIWPTLPGWPGLLTPVISNAFRELGISVAIWISDNFWHTIHYAPDVTSFEINRSQGPARWAYNFATFERVKQRRELVRGKHAGFHDLFVPLLARDALSGVLVTGPFARSYPTSAELTERWLALYGVQARMDDPVFSDYLEMTLGTLTLEGDLLPAYERLVLCFASLLTEQAGDAAAVGSEALELVAKVRQARFQDFMWNSARMLVSERTSIALPGHWQTELRELGLETLPEHAIVGLLAQKVPDPDPVNERLRRAEFQRQCVRLAREHGTTVSGKVGDRGVSFLVGDVGSERSAKRELGEIAARAATLARRLGFSLHAGIHRSAAGSSVPEGYRAALWAAEKALAEGARNVYDAPRAEPLGDLLRHIRDELERSVRERPDLLLPRFERYADAALRSSGYRAEATRIELELGLERVSVPLLAANLVDPKTLSDFRSTLDRAVTEAQGVGGLVAAYRRMLSSIEAALRQPVVARQARSTARAAQYARDHLDEPLTLQQGARVAGLAPSHFARLFRRDHAKPFARYVRELRLLRAKEMLHATSLSAEQIQKLCGFQSRTSFFRVFREEIGMTPAEFRASR
jgi:AraC-like DNA-binding protein